MFSNAVYHASNDGSVRVSNIKLTSCVRIRIGSKDLVCVSSNDVARVSNIASVRVSNCCASSCDAVRVGISLGARI